MKKRLLYFELIKHLDHKNALVITGMRQVGKTTLMKQIYEEIEKPKLWYDFDNPLDLMLFEKKDYNAIYRSLMDEAGNRNERLFVFIDEIQNFPEITKIIKYLIDYYQVKFIVTGSSNFYLRNLFPESLSGRKFLFTLQPMRFKEYLYFQPDYTGDTPIRDSVNFSQNQSVYTHEKRSYLYDQYMEYGGFPEVVTTVDPEIRKMTLKNIFASFFEKDLKLLSDVKDVRELRDLILLLVPRTGNILDVTRLSSEMGINRVKMYNYLEFLQGVFFLKLIPKYSRSVDRSVAGGKKVYFADNGLLNIIGRITEGQSFENAVAGQLAEYGNLSYYNQRNTREIDFILGETAFEVKLTGTPSDLQKLNKLAEELNFPHSYVISRKFNEAKGFLSPVFI
jgi:predicted AAA+ superfamily ATPase